MGHRVTVHLEGCPENKNTARFTDGITPVPPPASSVFLSELGEQIDPIRGLRNNKPVQMGSFTCALAGIIEPNRQSDHSPLLLVDQEDQASRPGQEHPAGQMN